MRNLKRALSLALASVMLLGMMVVGTSASYPDVTSKNNEEAIAVMQLLKVMTGDEKGKFNPEKAVTRNEMAVIMTKLLDLNTKDYAGSCPFTDVPAWAEPYVAACYANKIVSGTSATTYSGDATVTTAQAALMVLKALGYFQYAADFGEDWMVSTVKQASKIDLFDGLTSNANAALTRNDVAQMALNALEADVVDTDGNGGTTIKGEGFEITTGSAKYAKVENTKFDYRKDVKASEDKVQQLVEKLFDKDVTKESENDKLGRPATKWTYNTGDKSTTFVSKADVSYTKAVAECDVAHDLGLSADTAYTLIVNGQKQATTYTVNLTDTVTKMGAQGRLFEVYKDAKTIVMIDTFLAKVTYVADITYDAQGHVKTPATITLEVYDAKTAPKTTALTLKDYDANYGYAKDEYVLVNAYTKDTNSATVSGKVFNNDKQYAEILGKATSIEGAQSVIYWNAQQHNVEGTVYDDAVKFYLDEAAQKDAKYTWYFDSYNNLIGAVEIAAANSYGVINSIWWAGNATDGSGVAKANVTYVDGTTAQVDVSEMTYKTTAGLQTGTVTHSTGNQNKVMTADGGYFYVDSYINTNTNADTNKLLNGHLFRFTTKSNGTLKAVEVDNYVDADKVADSGKLHSVASLAVSKNTQVMSNGTYTLVVNSNTTFLVRSGAGTSASPYTFKSVTGFTNIDNYVAAEVDWVDLNGDNVADYVYVIGATTSSKVTSLFYFDGQQGAYTLSDGTWVVKGYVDGVAGEVKFANYAALESTLKINRQTGYPENNTLYVVTLKDGVVQSGHAAVDGEPLNGYNEYPLSSAYNTYSNITINFVEGDAGEAQYGYADRDTFADSLYHDYDANKYYSVVTDLTKVVGTMGYPAGQNYYFVSIQNNGQLNALALQAYAYDKVTSPSNPDGATKQSVADARAAAVNGKTITVNVNDTSSTTNDKIVAALRALLVSTGTENQTNAGYAVFNIGDYNVPSGTTGQATLQVPVTAVNYDATANATVTVIFQF